MKIQNNWRQKSIENLEKDNWGEVPLDDSGIVQRLYRLRKVPLEQLSADDIRFMIIQETGLSFLLTLALELLQDDLYVEGNYYAGDLLAAVLQIKPEHWKGNKELWIEIEKLLKDRLDEIRDFRPRLDIDNFYAAKFN
jgi:glycine betaine/choline ABC-type transport system substrate-binding protein